MKKSIFFLSLWYAQAWSAGFAIQEQGASGLGNAYAGAAAIAEDGSTLFFNPAGLSRLQNQIVLAGHVIMPKADFQNQGSYLNPALTDWQPLPGSLSGSNADGGKNAFVPNFYWVQRIDEQWVMGLGINAPFGLITEYDKDWVGRYHAVYSELKTLNINPSLSYQINQHLAIGAGISFQYAEATLSNKVDFGTICLGLEGQGLIPFGSCAAQGVLPQQADGYAKIKGDDWSIGFNLGLLWQVLPSTRLGLAYRSNINQDLEGRADFTVPESFQTILHQGIPLFTDVDAEAGIDLPETVSFSLVHAFNPRWTVLADISWTRWSRFDELRIEYQDNPYQPDTVQPENWNDSWRYALGLNYYPNQRWVWRTGIAYDETPIEDEYRTPRIPGNDRLWLSIGLGYQWRDDLSIDLGYAHLFVDDADSDALDHSTGHQLVGQYELGVDILSAQLVIQF